MIDDAISEARRVHAECTCGGHQSDGGAVFTPVSHRCRCHFHVEELLAVAEILQEELARLRGIFADLCQDSPPVDAAFTQGKTEGSLIEAKQIQQRIDETIASWKAPLAPGSQIPDDANLVIACLEVLKTCITHRGVTREEAVARANARLPALARQASCGSIPSLPAGSVCEVDVALAGEEFYFSIGDVVSYDPANRRLMFSDIAGFRRFIVRQVRPQRQTLVLSEIHRDPRSP